MECNELLEQEEAFHKLNAEIELRTRQLMKNVEAVINKQTSKHWSTNQLQEKGTLGNEIQKRYEVSPDFNDGNIRNMLNANIFDHGDQKILNHTTTGNRKLRNNKIKEHKKKELLENGLIPNSAKGMSAESLVRFLKAKGKLLQEELEHNKRDLQIKNEEVKKLHQDLKNQDDEKQKLLTDIGSLREKYKKMEVISVSQTEKLQMRDSENLLLKKEIEMLKQDIKRLNSGAAAHETKLKKSREETEKLKLLLKQSESNEKEAREKCRMTNDEMVAMVRKLEKQKSDLMSAIKKQVVLIENLKKQKELLESERGLNFTEKEFLKMLDGKYSEEQK